MKYQLILVFILSVGITQAQEYLHEPTSSHPYGKSNVNLPEENKVWEELIGTCDCKTVLRNPDGSWQDTTGMTWIWKYIMDGKAVQDISLKTDGSHTTSIRQYIPDSSSWYVTFFSSAGPSPSPRTWKGGKEGNDIILYNNQNAPNGMEGFYKITFQNISEKGFDWLGAWVDNAETIQYPTWKIFCKKRFHIK